MTSITDVTRPTASAREGQALQKARRRAVVLAAIQLFCASVFAFDVLGELHWAMIQPGPVTIGQYTHLGSEGIATLLVLWGLHLSRMQIAHLKSESAENRRRLRQLRGEFEALLKGKFSDWGLTESERDVAFLTIKGLSIAEIAAMRQTREGTVKAQLSTIFRKSGVSSRPAFLSLCVDELLDFAAGSGAETSAGDL